MVSRLKKGNWFKLYVKRLLVTNVVMHNVCRLLLFLSTRSVGSKKIAVEIRPLFCLIWCQFILESSLTVVWLTPSFFNVTKTPRQFCFGTLTALYTCLGQRPIKKAPNRRSNNTVLWTILNISSVIPVFVGAFFISKVFTTHFNSTVYMFTVEITEEFN